MDLTLFRVAQVVTIVFQVVALTAAAITVFTFWRNGTLRRAEWLSELHGKFYEENTYKRVRLILDYRPEPDYTRLRVSVSPKGGDNELAEGFVDYLNFFEFIATLLKLRQLSFREIDMMFDYYIDNLRGHQDDFVMEFVREHGFENLKELIRSFRSANRIPNDAGQSISVRVRNAPRGRRSRNVSRSGYERVARW